MATKPDPVRWLIIAFALACLFFYCLVRSFGV